MSPRRVDWLIDSSPRLVGVGLLLIVLGVAIRTWGVGTGMGLVWLGSTTGYFQEWRTAPRLWLLALAFLVLATSIWGLFAIGLLCDPQRAAAPATLLLDFAVCTSLLGLLIQFLVAVGLRNWKLTRRRA